MAVRNAAGGLGKGRLLGTLRRGARDQGGGVATIFALAAVPLILVTGVGIDVSRVVSARTALQDATDAAGLALGRMSPASTHDALQTKAVSFITANVKDGDIKDGVDVAVTNQLGVVTITASTQVQPTLAGIVHLGPFLVTSQSTIKYGLSHVELALVLDNTGSMAADNKLANLKTAATSLINTLSASAAATGDNDAFKVGIVPFSMAVNIGTDANGASYEGQSWLTGVQPITYGDDIVSTPGLFNRFDAFRAMHVTWKGCVESRPMDMDISDTPPTITNPASLFVPFFAPDEPDYHTTKYNGGYETYYNNYLSDGVVSSDYSAWALREKNPLKYTSTPTAATNNYWGDAVGPNSGCNIAPMTRLTPVFNDATRSPLITKINNMVATGDTEIPLGLIWGWHLLSPNMPFGSTTAYGAKSLYKIVVLVTDGENTYSTLANNNGSNYTAYGYQWQKRIHPNSNAAGTTSPQALNDRLTKLCTAMKQNNKIVIYTVPVEVSDTNTQSLLQNCASDPTKYIAVDSGGLQAAFNNIAGSISQLRISK